MTSISINYVVKRSLVVLLVLLYSLYFGLSHFGAPNPNETGLLSGVGVATFALALALLAAAVSRRCFVIVLFLSWVFICLVTIANWEYHAFSRSYFNYQIFRLGTSLLEGNKAAIASQHADSAIMLLSLTFTLVLYVGICFQRAAFPKRATLIASVLLMFASLGLFSKLEITLTQMRSFNIFSLNPAYLHPVHAFFVNDGDLPMESDRSWRTFKDLNSYAGYKNDYFPTDSLKPPDQARHDRKKYNVIMIVMESLRASFVGHYGNKENLTPNLDSIAKTSIVARNFYANSNFTVKGETALLCGIFDHNAKPSIAQYGQKKAFRCLPRILRSHNFKSVYVHGYLGNFYNRNSFMQEVGFDKLIFRADEQADEATKSNNLGWGASDVDMFQRLLNESLVLNQSGDPFFSYFLSLSSHYPFATPWPIDVPFETTSDFSGLDEARKAEAIYTNYKNAVYYSDHALGRFWEAFQQTQLYKNTIVVITGDHGIWSFDKHERKSAPAEKNEKFFRLPLVVYHPDLKAAMTVEQISSQIDVLPTLKAMLGINEEAAAYLGKNILRPVSSPWSVMMKSGLVYVRHPNQLCFLKAAECSNPHNSCAMNDIETLTLGLDGKVCSTIEGDLLTAGAVTDERPDDAWVDAAFGMIRYENFQALVDGSQRESFAPIAMTNLDVKLEHQMKHLFRMQSGTAKVPDNGPVLATP
jgi:phosphoglycerol transferase MdoB-like AlkP superfamily enzyme